VLSRLQRGIAGPVASADNSGMRLLLLAAFAFLGGTPATQTIAGTITANSGSSLTVASADRSLTCAVRDAKGAAALLKWGTGVRAGMACKRVNGRLVLIKLVRLDTTEPTRTTTEPTKTTTEPTKTTTEPPKTPTEPSPPQQKTAIGTVVGLRSDGVGVLPDSGGQALTCAITAATDSQRAAATLSLGARVGIVCRLDGTRYVLSGVTPLG
jgi:hypothetical protein